jgi:hypothetical protein
MTVIPGIKVRSALLLMACLGVAGCASMISSAASRFAENLSAAVLNQDDPETVRDGAPAYLLLVDSVLEGSPKDPAVLAAAANLYASYGVVFANDPVRAKRLTARARGYGFNSLCRAFQPACEWKGMPYDRYEKTLDGIGTKQAVSAYAFGVSSLAYIRTHSDDWNALAELPHVEALLNRYLKIGDPQSFGAVNTYLGILATLRPPALGGEPEKGRQYFERAIELTHGVDLNAKVEFARGYARLMYDRELHDKLLNEVLSADPKVPGYTLTNVLAQRDAVKLLASADDYF